jgi:hypothetical protein
MKREEEKKKKKLAIKFSTKWAYLKLKKKKNK